MNAPHTPKTPAPVPAPVWDGRGPRTREEPHDQH